MGGIHGIGGIPEPKSDRPASARENTPAASSDVSSASDDVAISSQAQAAAVIAKAVQATSTQPDIRTDRVAEAKAAIERGDYQKPEVVSTVADRLSKFI